MLRLLLPPNLASAAPRDAIALKVELDLAAPPAPELLPALALLQRWSGASVAPKFLQLKRAQLRDLVAALAGQPVFFWLNGPAAPIAWNDTQLSGVSIFLKPPPAEAAKIAQKKAFFAERTATTSTRVTVDGSEHYLAITLPSRESLSYATTLDLLKTNGFTLDPSSRKWWLRDRHKTLNFLATHGARLRENLDAEFTPNFEKNTAHLREAEIVCDAVEARNGFNLTVALKAGTADEAAIRSAVSANRGYIESDGKVYLLAADKLQKLDATQHALAGDAPGAGGLATRRTHAVSAARAAAAEQLLEEIAPHFQPPAAWRARTVALRNLSALAPAPLEPAFAALLRPYQKLGVAWLCHLHRHQLGGILADEMGLGKTLQALGLLSALRAPLKGESPELKDQATPVSGSPSFNFQPSPFNSRRASLVVCPASLVENWRREAARFVPHLRVFLHHGERRLASAADFLGYDLVVTSYGTLTRDRALFESAEFACVIADEAQHIKNRRSQNAQSLRALRASGRFLLTGTPLENSLDDLRSLFEFLMPGYLDKLPPGVRGEDRAWLDERLRAQTAPYILRRTKQAVAPELPAKLEQTIWCELTPAQAKLYQETQQRTEREFLDLAASGASESSLRFAALTQLLRLRQICCDPRLLPNSELRSPASDLRSQISNLRTPISDAAPAAFADSAKLDAFRELLAESVDDNHRLLVFSQFTSLLALLREELVAQEISHCYLDGSLTPRARQAEVDRFQSSPDIPVFLISLKAGGTGLNLTGADTVVHFDPWWNPAAEAQATDRAHRIGQTRVVTSYKLIASGTVEEKVLALQDEKRALLAGVFEASDAAAAKLSLADLKSLLQ